MPYSLRKEEAIELYEHLTRNVDSSSLATALQQLPDRKRITLEMTVDGYSFTRIAGRLGVSREMARQLLCGAIRNVAYRLDTDFTNPETPIDNVMIPTRCYNLLRRLNIRTVADITEYSEHQLSRAYGMGQGCIESVKKLLARFGLSLQGKSRQPFNPAS
ncbi:MAG TPA: DNA-directed RNA polymerase subunit alpha C-terminal domain-containing protein [Thermodesulfovibrionales bacterium]|nr:DNA-directed RNA polymerase subunit alpha C-terminal domain-containing protein [Thermodesulfovibrionales bacterium]